MKDIFKRIPHKKGRKQANSLLKTYLTSLLSLVLCCAMFLSTTFAWFSSDVTSSGNEIYIGMLNVDMIHDGKSVMDADTPPVFTGDFRWEPNATQIETLTLVNQGNLAFHYKLMLTGGNENLNAVGRYIDVYISESDTGSALPDFEALKNSDDWSCIGTLDQVISHHLLLTKGIFRPAEGVNNEFATISIALHMDENANEPAIMGKRITDIGIKLIAAQLGYENDVFGSDYDSQISTKWLEDPNADGSEGKPYILSTAADLRGLVRLVNGNENGSRSVTQDFKGLYIKLGADIDLKNELWTPIGYDPSNESTTKFRGTLDGDGHTISNLNIQGVGGNAGLFGAFGGTVKNLTVRGATVVSGETSGTGVVVGSMCYGGVINNVSVINAFVAAPDKVGGVVGFMDGIVTGCSASNVTVAATPNVVLTEGNVTYDNGAKVGGIVGYMNGNGNSGMNGGVNKVSDCNATNVTLKGYRDIGGIVGMGRTNADISGNTVQGTLNIVVDQSTKSYGEGNINAGVVVGRSGPDGVNDAKMDVDFTLTLSGDWTQTLTAYQVDTLVLKNVTVQAATGHALDLTGASGKIIAQGENVLIGAPGSSGIYVPENVTLDLSGVGSIRAVDNGGLNVAND